MARWVKVDDGPGVGTFIIVTLIAMVVIGKVALYVLPIIIVIALIRRFRQGPVTPADILAWIATPLILILLAKLFR